MPQTDGMRVCGFLLAILTLAGYKVADMRRHQLIEGQCLRGAARDSAK